GRCDRRSPLRPFTARHLPRLCQHSVTGGTASYRTVRVSSRRLRALLTRKWHASCSSAVAMTERPRVLIVDDELGVRESLRAILGKDCDVVTASSGDEARAQ